MQTGGKETMKTAKTPIAYKNELVRVNSCSKCVCTHCQERTTHDGCKIIERNNQLQKIPYIMQEVKVYEFTNQHDKALQAQEPTQ